MTFNLNDYDKNFSIMDFIDDPIMRCNPSGIGDVLSSYQWLRVSNACSGMLHDIFEYFM